MMHRPELVALGVLALAAAGCSHGGGASSPASTTPAAGPSAASGSGEPFTPGPSDVDLPAPSAPTSPAASTAGPLSLTSIPVPAGWKAIARKGSAEEGFLGNGTPAHARDPRYAAYEVMAVGCADVKRSAWTDPTSALEVNLVNGQAKGVAEAMVFATPEQATTWFALWSKQVAACQTGSSPRTTKITATDTSWTGRRSQGAGDEWAEIAAVTGNRVRLYLLADPSKQVTPAAQQALLSQLAGS